MYFQSFGASSVVKVNAPWFHVRERGFFGGVFGIMISIGYFARLDRRRMVLLAHYPFYVVFLVPAGAMLVMSAVDFFSCRDTPRHAGHADFDTGDASSGDDTPVDLRATSSARSSPTR